MEKTSDTIAKHLPVLTLVGGDQRNREQFLATIASALSSKSIGILVVFCGKDCKGSKNKAGTTSETPYDTVFFDHEAEPQSIPEKESARIHSMLSQYSSRYDLIILCNMDGSDKTELEIFEGIEQWGKALYSMNVDDDIMPLISCLYDWLRKQVLNIPVWGCLLIGGKSSRMGQPKHLIEYADGLSWGEKIVRTLSQFTERVVLSGAGAIPQSLEHLERIEDISDAYGPLAGILGAMRWNPHVSFIVAACDMPGIQKSSLQWLLNRRCPGIWGTVPLHPQSQRFEPLLALYDFRSRVLFEQLHQTGSLRPSQVCKSEKIEKPVIPLNLADSWRNCNTPEDLSVLNGKIEDAE